MPFHLCAFTGESGILNARLSFLLIDVKILLTIKRLYKRVSLCAGDNGFEPLLVAPEATVLPLDESPIRVLEYRYPAGRILACQIDADKPIFL